MKLLCTYKAVENAVAVLNEALAQDPRTIKALFTKYEYCNSALADSDTIQVFDAEKEGIGFGLMLRPLGLINGILGTLPDGSGPLAAEFNDEGILVRFINRAVKNE